MLDFLTLELYGINLQTAEKYCEIANIPSYFNPVFLTQTEIKSLYTALRTYSLSIPTESLSLIGETFIKSSLQKDYEFVDDLWDELEALIDPFNLGCHCFNEDESNEKPVQQ